MFYFCLCILFWWDWRNIWPRPHWKGLMIKCWKWAPLNTSNSYLRKLCWLISVTTCCLTSSCDFLSRDGEVTRLMFFRGVSTGSLFPLLTDAFSKTTSQMSEKCKALSSCSSMLVHVSWSWWLLWSSSGAYVLFGTDDQEAEFKKHHQHRWTSVMEQTHYYTPGTVPEKANP